MKILIAAITDAGVYRVRKELIDTLLNHGHKIVIVSPEGKDVPKLLKLGCSFIPIKIDGHGTNPIKDIGVFLTYIKILKKEHPDIVLTFSPKPNVYCGMACRYLQIPIVMNITGLGTALAYSGYKQKLLIFLYKIATKGIKRIFFQNQSNWQFFKIHNIGNEEKYYLLPGSGINLSNYSYQEYPKDDDKIHFLFVSRIQKEKGIDQYLEAAKEVQKNHSNVCFHVLGICNSTYEPIIRKAHEDGIIIYHGRVDNIPEFQKMSHATIMPSYYPEGICNVLLEAAATGRPVITTNHPGCRETVEDGVSGFLVEKKDTIGLIRAIEKLLEMSNTERANMGLAGRKKIEREFDRQIVVNAYMNEIK